MNKKKLILLIAVGVVVLATVIFISKPWLWLPDFLISKITDVQITDKKIIDNTEPFKIKVVYPQIKRQGDLNKRIKALIENEINSFKEIAMTNDQAIKELSPDEYEKYKREYDLNINYDKGQIDKKIISIVLVINTFEGGANGAGYYIPVNYNLETKTDVSLASLFPEQPDYLKKISDFSIKELTKQITDKFGSIEGTWIEDGAGPDEENFSNFLVNNDSIVFYFAKYQIAYGAAGSFKVIMPR